MEEVIELLIIRDHPDILADVVVVQSEDVFSENELNCGDVF